MVANGHAVVVRGTYTCGPFDTNVTGGGGTVDLTVVQGGVTGFGGVPIRVCDDTPQRYHARVTSNSELRFMGGAATVSASGLASGERDGQPITQRTALFDQPITIARG